MIFISAIKLRYSTIICASSSLIYEIVTALVHSRGSIAVPFVEIEERDIGIIKRMKDFSYK